METTYLVSGSILFVLVLLIVFFKRKRPTTKPKRSILSVEEKPIETAKPIEPPIVEKEQKQEQIKFSPIPVSNPTQAQINRYGYFGNLRQEDKLGHQSRMQEYKGIELKLEEKDLVQYEKQIELESTSKVIVHLQKELELSAKKVALEQYEKDIQLSAKETSLDFLLREINLTAKSLSNDIEQKKLEVGIRWLELGHKELDVERKGLNNILTRIELANVRQELTKYELGNMQKSLVLEEQRAAQNLKMKEIALDNQLLQFKSDKITFQEDRVMHNIQNEKEWLDIHKGKYSLYQRDEELNMKKAKIDLTEYSLQQVYHAKMEWLKIKDAQTKIEDAQRHLNYGKTELRLDEKSMDVKHRENIVEKERKILQADEISLYNKRTRNETELQNWENRLQLEEINRKWNTMKFIQKRWGLDYEYPAMKDLEQANYVPSARKYLEQFRRH